MTPKKFPIKYDIASSSKTLNSMLVSNTLEKWQKVTRKKLEVDNLWKQNKKRRKLFAETF
jgi:hypothetical protein